MNKSELVTAIAEKAEFTKKDTEKFLKSFEEAVTEALAKGDKIQLVGFGTFLVGERQAREGRNPQTGKTISIPSSNVPKFKAGQTLKDAVNGKN